MRIGIFGGSFNPIHFGHLITNSSLLKTYALDTIHLVVANTPPHKSQKDLISGQDRLNMVHLAVENDSRFFASDTEFREGQSPYTVELLRTYKNDFPNSQLFLIVGADSLLNFKSWYKWQELSTLCEKIIVLARPQYKLTGLDADIASIASFAENCPLIDISATQIRHLIQTGRSIRYYAPEKVVQYIEDNRLYSLK